MKFANAGDEGISTTYTQEGGDTDWVDFQVDVDTKFRELAVHSSSTSTNFVAQNVLTEGQDVVLYDGTSMVRTSLSNPAATSSDFAEDTFSITAPTFKGRAGIYNEGTLSLSTESSGVNTVGSYFYIYSNYLFVQDRGDDRIYQYILTDPNDILAGITLMGSYNYNTGSAGIVTDSIKFTIHPSGTRMYLFSGGSMWQFSLSNEFSILSGVTYEGLIDISTLSGGLAANCYGATIHSNGNTIYTVDADRSVYAFNSTNSDYINNISYGGISNTSLNIISAVSSPTSISFSQDGKYFLILDNSQDDIYLFSLDTNWDITGGLTYLGTRPLDGLNKECAAFFANDTRIFSTYSSSNQYAIVGGITNCVVSPSGDLYSYEGLVDYNTTSGGVLTSPDHFTMSFDGTKVYATEYGASQDLYQYSLTVPYDLTEGFTYDGALDITSINVSQTQSRSLAMSTDGKKLYVIRGDNDIIYQYSLSTPYTITSGVTYDSKSFTVPGIITPYDLKISLDGKNMFILDIGSNSVYEHTLSVPWDISTASQVGSYNFANTHALNDNTYAIAISPDGSTLLHLDSTDKAIYQYTLGTKNSVLGSVTYEGFLSISELSAIGVQNLTFNLYGDKLYILSDVVDDIYQFSLTAPWDVAGNLKKYQNAGTSFSKMEIK